MTVLQKIKQMDAEEFLNFFGYDSICMAIREHDPSHCERFKMRTDVGCDECVECWLRKRADYDDLYVE